MGNLVDDDAHTSLEISPLGNLNSTDITEQSFDPALLTNNSNQNGSKVVSGPILIQQFWISNNWGLGRFGKILFNAAIPLISVRNTNGTLAAPDKKPFQNTQSTTEIPSEYIFYQWAFFILAIWAIIDAIIDLAKLVDRE